MTIAQTIIDTSLRMQERIQGNPVFTYLQQTWPCVPGSLMRGEVLGEGPPIESLQRFLIVRKSALGTIHTADSAGVETGGDSVTADNDVMPPMPGHEIDYLGRIYEIESVVDDAAGVAWKVYLTSPNS